MGIKSCCLADLEVGAYGIVENIVASPPMKERFLDLGLIQGTKVQCLLEGYSKDIKVYEIRGALIAIRNIDAKDIFIKRGSAHVQKEAEKNV